jgi:hypothetical protein
MNTFDPADPVQQNAYLHHHPLVTNNHVALTPSMPKVLEMVIETIMLHKKSLVYQAIPQMGKTTACNFVVRALEQYPEFHDRVVIRFSADTNTEEPKRRESIVRILGRALGLRLPHRPELVRVRIDVLNEIESRLRGCAGRHWISFADEIQAFTIEDFEHLQYIQNELALRNIDTTFIAFAQTQIENTITLLRAQGRPELISRFLNEIYDLPHCTDHIWMSQTLKGYDKNFIYPVGSACTYTQFFLPQAYAAGLRLESSAETIYQKMEKSAIDAGLRVLPTVFIFEVFRLILIRSMKLDAPNFEVTEDIVEGAVKESHLHNYATHLVESKRKP